MFGEDESEEVLLSEIGRQPEPVIDNSSPYFLLQIQFINT